MVNQLGVLQTLFPRDVLFPKVCDLTVKPLASCVPAPTPWLAYADMKQKNRSSGS